MSKFSAGDNARAVVIDGDTCDCRSCSRVDRELQPALPSWVTPARGIDTVGDEGGEIWWGGIRQGDLNAPSAVAGSAGAESISDLAIQIVIELCARDVVEEDTGVGCGALVELACEVRLAKAGLLLRPGGPDLQVLGAAGVAELGEQRAGRGVTGQGCVEGGVGDSPEEVLSLAALAVVFGVGVDLDDAGHVRRGRLRAVGESDGAGGVQKAGEHLRVGGDHTVDRGAELLGVHRRPGLRRVRKVRTGVRVRPQGLREEHAVVAVVLRTQVEDGLVEVLQLAVRRGADEVDFAVVGGYDTPDADEAARALDLGVVLEGEEVGARAVGAEHRGTDLHCGGGAAEQAVERGEFGGGLVAGVPDGAEQAGGRQGLDAAVDGVDLPAAAQDRVAGSVQRAQIHRAVPDNRLRVDGVGDGHQVRQWAAGQVVEGGDERSCGTEAGADERELRAEPPHRTRRVRAGVGVGDTHGDQRGAGGGDVAVLGLVLEAAELRGGAGKV